ncbi:hypothetical protein PUN28_014142 [Cardiocondyla obscurior]|uniref:Uncharacterized protein n=1 Tax=Cardiocondyla obscurior TaxID=286306 RepID=A0AAW2EZU9_9HYME
MRNAITPSHVPTHRKKYRKPNTISTLRYKIMRSKGLWADGCYETGAKKRQRRWRARKDKTRESVPLGEIFHANVVAYLREGKSRRSACCDIYGAPVSLSDRLSFPRDGKTSIPIVCRSNGNQLTVSTSFPKRHRFFLALVAYDFFYEATESCHTDCFISVPRCKSM